MGWEIHRSDPGPGGGVLKFEPTPLPGAFVIEPEKLGDERGFFSRTFCQRQFAERGLEKEFVQSSISFNHDEATLRGLHYQAAPAEEAKLVRCTMGCLYDVIVDLRPDSPTFTKWHATQLSAENRRMVYIPRGLAHGFLTLQPNVEILYQITPHHDPALARGVRWNDPVLGIEWPRDVNVISARDRSYPDFDPDTWRGL